MMTRCLALELGPHGVRVNTVKYMWLDYCSKSFIVNHHSSPGLTATEFKVVNVEFNRQMREQRWKQVADKTPLGRVGYPLEIAKAVAFLASTEASFITGANLVVDGGQVFTLGGVR